MISQRRGGLELSRLNAKGQVTVPKSISDGMELESGDVLGWELDKQAYCFWLSFAGDFNHLRGVEAVLSELSTDADEAAFAGL